MVFIRKIAGVLDIGKANKLWGIRLDFFSREPDLSVLYEHSKVFFFRTVHECVYTTQPHRHLFFFSIRFHTPAVTDLVLALMRHTCFISDNHSIIWIILAGLELYQSYLKHREWNDMQQSLNENKPKIGTELTGHNSAKSKQSCYWCYSTVVLYTHAGSCVHLQCCWGELTGVFWTYIWR